MSLSSSQPRTTAVSSDEAAVSAASEDAASTRNGAAASAAPLLSLHGVKKHFGAVRALDGVDFDLRAGEIHALLGENGAGKSTLIKTLAGVHRPDAGTIRFNGEEAAIKDIADADRLGIRVIHQELSLAPNLSIAENIYLGREPRRGGWLRRGQMYADAEDLVTSLGLNEIRNVRATVSHLSVAHRQLVEIARALSTQARVLILDEPTSSLSESETQALFVTLERLREQGVGIIYISHRLEEIIRLADRVTVLRDGTSIGTRDIAGVDQRELVQWMVGRDITDYFHRPPHKPGEVALEVRDLWNAKVRGASLKLHYGEVLGLVGLVGSGRSELARAIFGIDPIQRGEVLVDGKKISVSVPRDALDAGIVLVPEDRKRDGLVMIQSVGFNAALPWTKDWNPSFLPNQKKRREIVGRTIQGFGVKVPTMEHGISGLSGGNQQKVLVGRWMEHRPKIVILDEPTRGVDVGAREEMFTIISSLVEEGMAVLLISSDLVEVMSMSHKLALYRDGRILNVVDAESITAEEIMHKLTGADEIAA